MGQLGVHPTPRGLPTSGPDQGLGGGSGSPERRERALPGSQESYFHHRHHLHLHTQAAITEGPSLTFPPTPHPASTPARSTVPGPHRGSL